MTENPYCVLGLPVPPLLGRKTLLQRIGRHLEKPSPDHVSVVGPAHYGKSVLLRHLAKSYSSESSGFLATVHVDLRHGTRGSDGAFKRRLGQEIKKALQPCRSELSEWIEVEDPAVHDLLGLVLGELEGEGARILVVLDGFDYVLDGPGLTRNLWDQLRSLAQKTSLRLVTGSRRPLRELCRTEESRTSDFWEIFYDTPVRVGALDEADWGPFLQPLLDSGCEPDVSARKEIANWTGGVPLLVCALLQELWEQHRGAHVSKPEIDTVAETILDGRSEILAALWDDCDVELRADLGKLAGSGIRTSDIFDQRRRTLLSRGFGRESRKRIQASCRLMQRYAERQAPALEDLTRLFGTASGFKTHVGSLLELRLKQITGLGADRLLQDFVGRAVREVGKPELAITGIRGVVERALLLIWKAELPQFPQDRTLPERWLYKWQRGGVTNLPEDQGRLPSGSGRQCHVLRLITGSDRMSRQSRYVTKTTSLLVDHLHSVGNFGQHRSQYPETEVSVAFAAAVVMAAISLVESLTSDLQRVGGS